MTVRLPGGGTVFCQFSFTSSESRPVRGTEQVHGKLSFDGTKMLQCVPRMPRSTVLLHVELLFIWSHLRNKPFRALCCCCCCLLSTQPSIRTDMNSAECQPQCWVPPKDHLIRAAQVGAILIPHKTIIVLACCTDIETDTETKAQRG